MPGPRTILAAAALLASSGCSNARATTDDPIVDVMQRTADALSVKYNMSIALAYTDGTATPTKTVAAGFTDAGLGIGTPTRPAQPDDVYVWGSITKMFTAPAVLQLVEAGAIHSLDDPIVPYVDPFLQANGVKSLEEHFDSFIQNVTVHHLLHMQSGISDYDGEAYARDQFANKSKDFSPIEILENYVSPHSSYAPGTKQSYCSTNYIILGMLLASLQNESAWQHMDQRVVFPQSGDGFNGSHFVDAGTCSQWTPVHGILEGYSTAKLAKQDVWNVSCVGGWTAGNYLGPVSDVAEFTYDLYGPQYEVVSASTVKQMIDFEPYSFYGMGTFDLDWSIGKSGTPAYGHVGDTYGYQSQTTYFPTEDFALAVATNVETNSQAQPAEATCLLFNAIAAIKKGDPVPNCTFTVPHRFVGTCTCK